MIAVTYKNTGITGIVTAVRLEKTASAAGAQAEVSLICSPQDRFLPIVNPACGDSLSISWNGEQIFSGAAERVSFSADGLSLTLLCCDRAGLLAKNEVYATLSGSPAQVAAKVCALAGISLAGAWDKAGSVLIPASTAQSAHSLIRQAYGGQCVTEWTDGGVAILKPGGRRREADLSALLSASASHSAEAMVNRVQVVGYLGRTDAAAQNSADAASFGPRTRVYTLTGAQSTAAAQAQGALSGVKRQASVTAYGFHNVRCGDCISLDAKHFGIEGDWTVTSACHEFSRGFCTTALGLVKED